MRLSLSALLALYTLAACSPEGAPAERRALHGEDVPAYLRMVREDREKVLRGVQEAAQRVEPAYRGDVDQAERARRLTDMLDRVDAPRRGVAELVFSPVLFIGGTDQDGALLAEVGVRDGAKVGLGSHYRAFEVVQQALAGTPGHAVVDLAEIVEEDEGPTDTWLFAAPIFGADQEVMGALVAGIPLWRQAQRLTAQMRLEQADAVVAGRVVWAYLARGDQAYASREPTASNDVTDVVPDAATRTAGLRRSPGGYVTDLSLFRRWYGLAVIPLPTLAEDVHLVAFRANAPE
ncbi:MAG: hypothetical protein AAF447_21225 [Myxococcota bacterium]